MVIRLFITPGPIEIPTFNKRMCKYPRFIVIENIRISGLISRPTLQSRMVGMNAGMFPSLAAPTRKVEARERWMKIGEKLKYL